MCLKDSLHRGCWKNFQVRVGMSKVFRGWWNNWHQYSYQTSRQWQTMNYVYWWMWSCWWLMFREEDASQTHQSVLELSRNTGSRRSSVGCIVHDLICRGKQCAYSLVSEFSGSVVTQLRWSGKVSVHLEYQCGLNYRRKRSGNFETQGQCGIFR